MTFLSVNQVAERWGVAVQQVLAHVHTATLEAVNVGRKDSTRPTWRIPLEAVEKFELQNSTAPDASKTRRKKQTAVKEYF